MTRNFYIVLGVSRDADPRQIKSAYRQLVKRYHPDRGGEPADRFHEVQQAYETLTDVQSREDHDRRLKQEEHPRKPAIGVRYTPSPRRPPERMRGPGSAEGLFGAVDEFFSGFVPGLFTSGKQASHQKDLYVELELSAEEARAGGLFPLRIPVEHACEDCRGTAYRGRLVCATCRGQGRVIEYPELQISVPPEVEDGEVQRLSLDAIGLPETELVVLVTVNP